MKSLNQFIRHQKGAVFIIVGFCAVMMVGITAAAIDYSRGSLLKGELVSALDAAALAGGTMANSTSMNAVVTKYFNANMPKGYLGATIDPLTITLAADKSTLTVGSGAHMKDAMLQVVGGTMTNVKASTQVTIEKKGMEIVLVLDNTGSMTATAGGGVTKLDALKTAATTLVNIIYGSKTVIDNLWVGVVPFSQAVNIGSTHSGWTSGTSFNISPGNVTTWGGCVEAREASGRDVTDDPPSVAAFPQYYSSCFAMGTTAWTNAGKPTWWNAWYGTNTGSASNPSPPYNTNCTSSTPIKSRSGISNLTYGPNQYCPQAAVLPMTATKATILSKINAMTANGDTDINLGLVWGWRLLSPRWRFSTGTASLWGGDMDVNGNSTTNKSPTKMALPLNYKTPLMNKVVVLLTDGDNSFLPNNYTAYGQLTANRSGAACSVNGSGTTQCVYNSSAEKKLDDKTKAVCDAMKASDKGIIIYTVALGTSISANGKALLKYCASQPEYYFESPTGNDLQTAFTTIGDSLSNLRISQ